MNSERFKKSCEAIRRDVRNITKRYVHLSSEHRLAPDQISSAFKIAEAIDDLKDPSSILRRFKDINGRGPIRAEAVRKTVNTLAVGGIVHLTGFFDDKDRTHELLVSAAGSSAYVTIVNCGIYDYAEGVNENFADYFLNDHTEKFSGVRLGGRSVRSVCIAPSLGREWVRAQTQALVTYDPTIRPRYQI